MKNAQQSKTTRSDWDALVKAMRQRTIISHVELVSLVRRYTAVTHAYALQRLKQDKVLSEVGEGRRGVYLVTEKDQAAFAEDPLEAIQTIYGSGAQLAYGTALFLHGLSRYGRLSEYFVITANTF